jgi:hypothetical protein
MVNTPPEIVAGPETTRISTGNPDEATALTANGASPKVYQRS